MKIVSLTLGLMMGISSLGNSISASDLVESSNTSESTSSHIHNSDNTTQADRKTTESYIDREREKFFQMMFVPEPDHTTITSIFQKNMGQIVNTSRTFGSSIGPKEGDVSSSQSLGVSLKDQDEYKKYVILKAKTTYFLPQPFEDGYLFSSKQTINALNKLGIDKNLLRGIDRHKFWLFSVRCLELPASSLAFKEEDDLLNSYLTRVNKLMDRFEMRLKEDSYTLLGYIDIRKNIMSDSTLSNSMGENITSRFMKPSYPSYKGEMEITESSIIQEIVKNRGYDTRDLDELLMLKPFYTFTRLCNALDSAGIKSWNSPDTLSPSVRVAEKLRNDNDNADITPELMETVDHLLVRQYNKLILEEIRDNFAKALRPKKGFENDLSDELF